MRRAIEADLPALVGMLADDPLGAKRERLDDMTAYQRALSAINADPNQYQAVVEQNGEIVGMMQLTVIPGLSHHGTSRLLIEAVRVRADLRGAGIGAQMMHWAIQYGRDHACRMVELTTNAQRTDAHRFYERLGFVRSHYGYKYALD